jgi:hypothetical protein
MLSDRHWHTHNKKAHISIKSATATAATKATGEHIPTSYQAARGEKTTGCPSSCTLCTAVVVYLRAPHYFQACVVWSDSRNSKAYTDYSACDARIPERSATRNSSPSFIF